jgi:WD40 repeat protein
LQQYCIYIFYPLDLGKKIMKKYRFLIPVVLLMAYSCQEKEDPLAEPQTFGETESEWIRLAVWNDRNQLGLMNPLTKILTPSDVEPFVTGSANYVSSSGRYVVSVERVQNNVRFFDSGIENHSDHGHEYPMRWLSGMATAPLPTHFSSTSGNIIIFNDGDGSVTIARESAMESPAFQPTILTNLNNGTHHGAATWLTGNKLAVTYKNPAVPGALPQFVKIVNLNGEVVFENNEVAVTGIHGDASNGQHAVFGATEGVIVAGADNSLKLIANPSPLTGTSGNWMGTIRANDAINKFYGFARNHGIFEIDPIANSIKPILSSNTVRSYFLSADGGYLVVQENDNRVHIFETATGNSLVSRIVTSAQDQASTNARKILDDIEFYRIMNEANPLLTASEQFLYVLEPGRSKVHVRDIKTLDVVESMDVPSNTMNIMRIGFQTK